MESIKKYVGIRIRQYRNKLKMSQEKLAELSELNTVYIGVIERGEKNPSIDILYRISKGLGIPLAELFKNIDGADGKNDDYPQKLYSLMLDLSPGEQKIIYEIVTSAIKLK